MCERFDHLIRLYYDAADRGYIETTIDSACSAASRSCPSRSPPALTRAKTYAGLAELARERQAPREDATFAVTTAAR